MAFKLIESAQGRWRAVNAPHLVVLVAPERCSRRASSSNDPTTRAKTQEVINKSPDTTIHRS